MLGGRFLALLAAIGTLLGIVPVAIGLLTWPAMRRISQPGLNFLLALTVGFLAFLLIETIGEGLESAGETVGRLRGGALFWVIFALTTIGLLAGRRHGRPPSMKLQCSSLSESDCTIGRRSLAVGAALATGAAALHILVIGYHTQRHRRHQYRAPAKENPGFLHFVCGGDCRPAGHHWNITPGC
jgi:hypothetical protein